MNERRDRFTRGVRPEALSCHPRVLCHRRAGKLSGRRLSLGLACSLFFHAGLVGVFLRLADSPPGIAALDIFPVAASAELNAPGRISLPDNLLQAQRVTTSTPPVQALTRSVSRATPKPSSPASEETQRGAADSPALLPSTPELSTASARGLFLGNPVPAGATTHEEAPLTGEYLPPAVPVGIALTNPQEGHVLSSGAPPIIVVEGQVEDRSVSAIWLVTNDRRIAVRAHDGRFRHILPVLDSLLHLWVETPPNGGSPLRSGTVTVHAAAPWPHMVVLVMNWPPGVVGVEVEMSASWRANPERLDGPAEIVPLEDVRVSPDGAPAEVFYLRNWKPGTYTFVVSYRASVPATDVRPTLYLPDAGTLSARSLKPVSLNGTGTVVLAKVLLPPGVLWEEDEWFTGRGESAEAVTKFRFPEGITWTELKADLR